MVEGSSKRTNDRNSPTSNVPFSKLLLLVAGYHTSDRLIDFFSPDIYITSASSSQDFCSLSFPLGVTLGGDVFFRHCLFRGCHVTMTHDQHNEAPNLLHVSDIFSCHSHASPPTCAFICFLFHVSLHNRLVTPSVSNHPAISVFVPFTHSSCTHSNIDFFFLSR